MLLKTDLEFLISQRPISKDTANQYRKAIDCFSDFLGRPAKRTDLSEPLINRWLTSLPSTLAPDTVRIRKAGVLVLWNWLASLERVKPYNVRLIRTVKKPTILPASWTIPQVRILLQAATRIPDRLQCGITARELLTAWILVGYETGMRPGDIMLLKPVNVDGNVIRIIQHKTGYVHCSRITNHTRAALETLAGYKRPYLFGLAKSTRRTWEKRLFDVAETLGFTRTYRQGLGTLRKTHATEICRTSDASAAAFSLGHVGGSQIAIRHYISPDAIGLPKSPPEIGGAQDGKKRTGDCN
jgi:integrase